MAHNLKNCYLIFNSDYNEGCLYGSEIMRSADCVDCLMIDRCTMCYECINCVECYGTKFSEDCYSCRDVWFSKDCVGCSDCFGCVNLRKQRYHIFNEPYSKEEYFAKLKEFNLQSRASLQQHLVRAESFWSEHGVFKYMHGKQNENVTGDYINNSRYVDQSFVVTESENCKHCMWLLSRNNKDCYDYTQFGENTERMYEALVCGQNATDIYLSSFCVSGVTRLTYCQSCSSSSDLFGCVGLTNKQYCILNRQYSKDEYFNVRNQLVGHMRSTGEWGEFPPIEHSPFAYNETTAQEYFPLTQQEVLARGYRWKTDTEKTHTVTIFSANIPDRSDEIDPKAYEEIYECSQSSQAFQVVRDEALFYQRMKLPLPNQHQDVRHQRRLIRRNLPFFYERTTTDGQQVLTAYATHQPEKIYGEEGYNQLVN